jgi:hypothetical protein
MDCLFQGKLDVVTCNYAALLFRIGTAPELALDGLNFQCDEAVPNRAA